MDKKIAFIGAGSLAESIISGIIKSNVVSKDNIIVTNKSNISRLEYIQKKYQVQCRTNKEEMTKEADIIILAIKPKDAIASLESIRDYIKEEQLIISVIAGLSTETIEHAIGIAIPVIRVMPNTSALIGQSATAFSGGTYVKEEHIQTADLLFQTVGITKLVDEKDMHTVTAISGSGPAFIYYFVEAMEKAAVESGLDHATASDLITQSVIGAGKMLQQSGDTPAVLRKKITSQGGTTEAGIAELDRNNFQEIIISCIHQARERSIDIGNGK
ncbi:pyrroline-5-carboxylate reductase [Oceanobacillus saliphilus]|uniref:pyrroline-5-carboxylate reductase n=1 Tax=Oceanobacillus saliphilus TaxID=2925834 RepID=UPI00201D3890|nr:pyrroline-5-carboxylate reductase [Oceanobacillus saliphilus]